MPLDQSGLSVEEISALPYKEYQALMLDTTHLVASGLLGSQGQPADVATCVAHSYCMTIATEGYAGH
jgi:hypothetical protein